MKEQIGNWSEGTMGTIQHFWANIASNTPKVIGGILLLILGWLIAKFLSRMVKKVFSSKKLAGLTKTFDESSVISAVEMDINLATVLSRFVYWVVMILFLVIVSDNMGWSAVSEEIGSLFRYLPKLFIATIIFVIGMYIADVIRQLLKASLNSISFGGGTFVSNVVYYIIMILITITALNQAGVETTLISSNLSIIIGCVLLAFAIGFGLASRDVIRKMLFSYYSHQSFEVGQHIRCGEVEGEIVRLSNMSAHVKTSQGTEVIPIDVLMSTTTRVNNS